jgi:hypothetical protein
MKKLLGKLISVVLVIALMLTYAPAALAAPSRNQGKVTYLSGVAIIEAKSDDDAQKILTELKKSENGGFTNMISLDLNKGGKTKIFLAYKTSTNVDDAITDLAIMNMEGNFSMGNYEQVLAENMESFKSIADDYRVIAKEFAEAYAAGSVNAKTAYRQLNLYYVEENGTKTYMGDYMLNFPETDESFAEILFRGNLKIIANIRSLMSMSVGGGETTLAARIAEEFKKAETDSSVYNIAEYLDAAKAIREDLEAMKSDINNLEAEIAETDKSTTLDNDQKEFIKGSLQNSLDIAKSYYELLKEIPMGTTTLGDYVMNTPIIDENKLFPVVAAGTAAERLLMEYHSFYTVLLYDVLELNGEALEAALTELEEGVDPLSVYHGVQNNLVSGTIGVTGDATSHSNASGKSFLEIFSNDETQVKSIVFSVLGAGGLASMVGGIAYLFAKASAIDAANQITRESLQQAVTFAKSKIDAHKTWVAIYTEKVTNDPSVASRLAEAKTDLANAKTEYVNAQNAVKDSANYAQMTGGQFAFGATLFIAGAIMIGVSIWQLKTLYNQFATAYTDIPDNMVDVVSHKDGDRFINYINVPAYYYDSEGALKTRENDLNAYDGRQWVSLYYTKNYEAGYCLTASPDLVATESAKKGYTPLHLFGRTDGYNTNSHCNRNGAESVYLAFKYSTNQKSAVTDVPNIVGSIFNAGIVAISALVGFSGGAVMMVFVNKKKAKPSKTNA